MPILILLFLGAFKNFKYRTKVQLAKSPHIDPADVDAMVLVEWRREVKKAQEKRQREELLGTPKLCDEHSPLSHWYCSLNTFQFINVISTRDFISDQDFLPLYND